MLICRASSLAPTILNRELSTQTGKYGKGFQSFFLRFIFITMIVCYTIFIALHFHVSKNTLGSYPDTGCGRCHHSPHHVHPKSIKKYIFLIFPKLNSSRQSFGRYHPIRRLGSFYFFYTKFSLVGLSPILFLPFVYFDQIPPGCHESFHYFPR